MKKGNLIAFLLTGTILLSLAACVKTEDKNPTKGATSTVAPTQVPEPTAAPTQAPVPAAKTVAPLPVTIDMNNLTNCTVAVSIEKEALSADNIGAKVLPVTVYTYDLYDMIDIAMLEVGDTIILRQEEVVITDLVRTESGSVQINGGLDMGGYELITNEETVYFETGYSDAKTYFALGSVVLPVSDDFVFIDKADPEGNTAEFNLEDLFTDKVAHIYGFTPHSTRIVIENGVVTQMERFYTP